MRREYAGNYTQSLVENAYKKLNAEQKEPPSQSNEIKSKNNNNTDDDEQPSTLTSSSSISTSLAAAAAVASSTIIPSTVVVDSSSSSTTLLHHSPPHPPPTTTTTATTIPVPPSSSSIISQHPPPPPIHITSTTTTIIDSESPVEDQNKLDRLVSSDKSSRIADELIYLIDAPRSSSSTSLTISDSYSFETRRFSFRKERNPDEAMSGRQPSLSEIMENFRSGRYGPLIGDCIDPSSSSSGIDGGGDSMSQYPFAAPFPLGIKLRPRAHPLETGSHTISHVETGSMAHAAGIKPGSRLVRINEIAVEDKTHEFVLFFLNYVLRKNSCELIELTVEEPVAEIAPTTTVNRGNSTSLLSISENNNNNRHQGSTRDDNSIISNVSSSSETFVNTMGSGRDNLRSIMSEAAQHNNHLKSSSSYTGRPVTSSAYAGPAGSDTVTNMTSAIDLSVSTPAIYTTSTMANNPNYNNNYYNNNNTTAVAATTTIAATSPINNTTSTTGHNLSLYNLNNTTQPPPPSSSSTHYYYSQSTLPTTTTTTSLPPPPHSSTATLPSAYTSTYTTMTSVQPAATLTSTGGAVPPSSSSSSSSTGIENLKSIIAQITRINQEATTTIMGVNTSHSYDPNPYDALRAATTLTTSFKSSSPPMPARSQVYPTSGVEEYHYETSIKIGGSGESSYQQASTSQPPSQQQQQPDHLKLIFTEAINSNYDEYMKSRGILLLLFRHQYNRLDCTCNILSIHSISYLIIHLIQLSFNLALSLSLSYSFRCKNTILYLLA